MTQSLQDIALALTAKGKGILAADQSPRTIDKQLTALGIPAEAEMRRKYRQLLLTTPGIEEYVTGVILHDGTIRNHADDGSLFSDVLISKGIIPIIKVDKSTVPHTGFEGEVVTQGLDGLSERLQEYFDMGARAAKWRAVFTIGKNMPSDQNILFDCITLARYAQLCQKVGIVPIVEPEVLFAGSHSLERAEEVTTTVLQKLFEILKWYKVDLSGVILKSSMVLAGSEYSEQTSSEDVAQATLRTFKKAVPEEIPGIVFLSGGQTPERATLNLDAISKLEKQNSSYPWEMAFSFSRGIEQPVQKAWLGKDENVGVAQEALIQRLRLNSLADTGEYDVSME